MELKILKIICDEVINMYRNEVIELGQNINKDIQLMLKNYKMEEIEHTEDFANERLLLEVYKLILTGLTCKDANYLKKPTDVNDDIIEPLILGSKATYTSDDDQIYRAGFRAFTDGKNIDDCPYDSETIVNTLDPNQYHSYKYKRRIWIRGFNDSSLMIYIDKLDEYTGNDVVIFKTQNERKAYREGFIGAIIGMYKNDNPYSIDSVNLSSEANIKNIAWENGNDDGHVYTEHSRRT